jgi:hypothetical protein
MWCSGEGKDGIVAILHEIASARSRRQKNIAGIASDSSLFIGVSARSNRRHLHNCRSPAFSNHANR